jgi:hypothetical protein
MRVQFKFIDKVVDSSKKRKAIRLGMAQCSFRHESWRVLCIFIPTSQPCIKTNVRLNTYKSILMLIALEVNAFPGTVSEYKSKSRD